MKNIFFMSGILFSSALFAESTTSTLIIKETVNLNIKHESSRSDNKEIRSQKKFFCGTTAKASQTECERWLKEQKKSLDKKVLTSYCSPAKFLYGSETEGCMAYLSEAELSYTVSL